MVDFLLHQVGLGVLHAPLYFSVFSTIATVLLLVVAHYCGLILTNSPGNLPAKKPTASASQLASGPTHNQEFFKPEVVCHQE